MAPDSAPPAPPAPPARRARLPAWLRLLALTLLVTLVWCAHYERWTPSSWLVPTHYTGDSLEILARLAAAAEGDALPPLRHTLHRLGAPHGADWTEYPASDRVLMALLGWLARFTGWAFAANFALWLAAASAALSFYACTRFLRHDRLWCFAGAVLFAFTYQAFARGLPHLLLAYSWTIPPALLSCWLVAGGGAVLRRRGPRWFVWGTAAWLGVSNPYVLLLYLQLLGLALLVRLLREGPEGREGWRAPHLRVGALALGIAVACFVLFQLDFFLRQNAEGGVPILERNFFGTERYALKPIELALPPDTHRWGAFAFIGQRYQKSSQWLGEPFFPYLGVIGLLAFAILAWETLRQAARGGRIPAPGLQAIWVGAFASVGGLNNLVALLTGVQVFRATNRYSLFLSALALLFAVSWLSRRTRHWPLLARGAVVTAVLVVGLLDQVPPRPSGRAEEIAARHAADRAFGQALEAALPRGTMVFQLPVMGFPEVVPPGRMSDYAPFRPYLHTTSLRFSYGALKGRARGQWQHDLAWQRTAKQVAVLEAAGFGAILIDRDGFRDHGETTLERLARAGRPATLTSADGDLVLVPLQPAASPRPPFARTPVYGRGWRSPFEREFGPGWRTRWAHEDAVLSYYNPTSVRLGFALRGRLHARGARTVELWLNDEPVGHFTFDADHAEIPLDLSDLTLRPGPNRLDLRTNRPAVRDEAARGGLRAFGLSDLDWRITDPAAENFGIIFSRDNLARPEGLESSAGYGIPRFQFRSRGR
jgi:hypothetical protein